MADAPLLRAQVTACAKINLDLRILAREESGFHQLETIFQRISLADLVDVAIAPGNDIVLQCTPSVHVTSERNLAWRAATLYRNTCAWPTPDLAISITIEKQIPVGAGLGGGSADAGAVLRALNELNPNPMPQDALLTLASTLGADVPFLASASATVLAWGRGERMLAIESLPPRRLHLATFDAGVNTASAYRALADARRAGRSAGHGSTLHDASPLGSWDALHATAVNDFEEPVFAMRRDIAAVHAAWSAAAPGAIVRMSGSGATIFAISDTDADADALAACATQWSAASGIRHAHASTLDHVPAVAIL